MSIAKEHMDMNKISRSTLLAHYEENKLIIELKLHTISNSFGWVSIYTRASARCDSTFEIATEPLNFIFLPQASTDAAEGN